MTITAYKMFCGEKRPEIKRLHPEENWADITKLLGKLWKEMDDDAKQAYVAKVQAYNEALPEEVKSQIKTSPKKQRNVRLQSSSSSSDSDTFLIAHSFSLFNSAPAPVPPPPSPPPKDWKEEIAKSMRLIDQCQQGIDRLQQVIEDERQLMLETLQKHKK